jgi:carbonic anhydrase
MPFISAGSKHNLTRGSLTLKNLLPNRQEHYYTYAGGLTTPSCHGAVMWVIYKNPIYVTKEQVRNIGLLIFPRKILVPKNPRRL